ncbi:MAG: YccF domain-containing protein [Myxococcales bacterium]
MPEHYTCCPESRSAHGELCLSVIGIPFGVQCFKIASLGLTPFGKTIDDRGSSPLGFFFNVLRIVSQKDVWSHATGDLSAVDPVCAFLRRLTRYVPRRSPDDTE